jgi:hypothetical protein
MVPVPGTVRLKKILSLTLRVGKKYEHFYELETPSPTSKLEKSLTFKNIFPLPR